MRFNLIFLTLKHKLVTIHDFDNNGVRYLATKSIDWAVTFAFFLISVGNHVTQSMYGLHHVDSVIVLIMLFFGIVSIVTTTRSLMSSRVGESSRIKIMYTVHTSSEFFFFFFCIILLATYYFIPRIS
jgi:hypothetical protein